MRYRLLLLTLLIHHIAQAQYQYVPMPLNDSLIWHVRSVVCESVPPHTSAQCQQRNNMYMIDGSDTIINGYAYKKIVRRYKETYTNIPINNPFPLGTAQNSIADNPDDYYGFVREENKRIIIYSNNSTDTIFDFNFAIGQESYHMGTIVGIDTILFNGKYRKRFFTTQYYWHGWRDTIIEGVGSLRNGLFWNGDPTATCLLDCFSDNNNILYTSPAGACSYVFPYGTATSVSSTKQQSLQVYPNPFKNELKIENSIATSAILYNTMGAKMFDWDLKQSKTVNTSQLPAGIYHISLFDEKNNIIHRQQLVKE